jgi:pyrimidine-nucleoside phosphorylase
MNQPLGHFAGVWCEVLEAVDVLTGSGPADTLDLTLELGTKLLIQASIASGVKTARNVMQETLDSGKAYDKFLEMVAAQGGNPDDFQEPSQLNRPQFRKTVLAPTAGVIEAIDTTQIGWASVELGCGRKVTTDRIDPTAGMEIYKKPGDVVEAGDPLLDCFCSEQTKLEEGCRMALGAYRIGEQTPEPEPLIYSVDAP